MKKYIFGLLLLCFIVLINNAIAEEWQVNRNGSTAFPAGFPTQSTGGDVMEPALVSSSSGTGGFDNKPPFSLPPYLPNKINFSHWALPVLGYLITINANSEVIYTPTTIATEFLIVSTMALWSHYELAKQYVDDHHGAVAVGDPELMSEPSDGGTDSEIKRGEQNRGGDHKNDAGNLEQRKRPDGSLTSDDYSPKRDRDSPEMPPSKREKTNEQEAAPLTLVQAVLQNNVELVHSLLAEGADPDAAEDGLTPLIAAITVGSAATCELLLQNQADPNLAVTNGDTPLVFAMGFGLSSKDEEHINIICQLIDCGADVTQQLENGETIYQMFLTTDWEDTSVIRQKAAKQLLSRNMSVAYCPSGRAPLLHQMARNIERYPSSSWQMLIENGANPDQRACCNRDGTIVRCCYSGLTPLSILVGQHQAGENIYAPALVLLSHGANALANPLANIPWQPEPLLVLLSNHWDSLDFTVRRRLLSEMSLNQLPEQTRYQVLSHIAKNPWDYSSVGMQALVDNGFDINCSSGEMTAIQQIMFCRSSASLAPEVAKYGTPDFAAMLEVMIFNGGNCFEFSQMYGVSVFTLSLHKAFDGYPSIRTNALVQLESLEGSLNNIQLPDGQMLWRVMGQALDRFNTWFSPKAYFLCISHGMIPYITGTDPSRNSQAELSLSEMTDYPQGLQRLHEHLLGSLQYRCLRVLLRSGRGQNDLPPLDRLVKAIWLGVFGDEDVTPPRWTHKEH